MPIDPIGLALGKVSAESQGVQPPASTRIAAMTSLITTNPLISVLMSRVLARNELQRTAPPPPPTGGGTDPGGTDRPPSGLEQQLARQVADLSQQVQTLTAEVEELRKQLAKQGTDQKGKGG